METGLNNDELRKLQLTALDILLEVKRICDKHGIKYSLAYGTLLGAVRHQGYIPWDDDTDVIMSRPEYNRFISVCESELNSRYYLFSFSEIEDRVRVCDKFVHCFEKQEHGDIIESDLWVDVYVYDKIILSSKAMIETKYLIPFLEAVYYFKTDTYQPSSFLGKFIKLFSPIIPLDYCKKGIYYLKTKYERSDATHVINHLAGVVAYPKHIYSMNEMSQFTNILFENHKFSCISNYEVHLSRVYGDYMTPVKTHSHIVMVDYLCE